MKITSISLILLIIYYNPSSIADSNERLLSEIINPTLMDIEIESNMKENTIVNKIGLNHLSNEERLKKLRRLQKDQAKLMAEKRNKKAAESLLKANRQRLEKESFKYGVPVLLSNYLASTNENAPEETTTMTTKSTYPILDNRQEKAKTSMNASNTTGSITKRAKATSAIKLTTASTTTASTTTASTTTVSTTTASTTTASTLIKIVTTNSVKAKMAKQSSKPEIIGYSSGSSKPLKNSNWLTLLTTTVRNSKNTPDSTTNASFDVPFASKSQKKTRIQGKNNSQKNQHSHNGNLLSQKHEADDWIKFENGYHEEKKKPIIKIYHFLQIDDKIPSYKESRKYIPFLDYL